MIPFEANTRHVLKFKYLGGVFDESGTDDPDCNRKGTSEKIVGTIRSLVKATSLQLDCAGGLYEPMLVPVLSHGSTKIVWREEESYRWTTRDV